MARYNISVSKLLLLYNRECLDDARIYLYENIGYFIDIAKRKFKLTVPTHLLGEDLGNSVFLKLDESMRGIDREKDEKQIITFLYYTTAGAIVTHLGENINSFMRVPTNKIDIYFTKDVIEKTESEEGDKEGEWIEDESQQNFKEDINNEMIRALLCEQIVGSLPEKEQIVVLARFPLHGQKKYTYKEIAEKLGCSLQWVKQLENKALRKLKKIIKGKL